MALQDHGAQLVQPADQLVPQAYKDHKALQEARVPLALLDSQVLPGQVPLVLLDSQVLPGRVPQVHKDSQVPQAQELQVPQAQELRVLLDSPEPLG